VIVRAGDVLVQGKKALRPRREKAGFVLTLPRVERYTLVEIATEGEGKG